jgi:hypothetical protein
MANAAGYRPARMGQAEVTVEKGGGGVLYVRSTRTSRRLRAA